MSELEKNCKEFVSNIERLGFKNIEIKDIAYGKNIFSYYDGKRCNFRIYFSKKKGITHDFSQIKDKEILLLFDKKNIQIKNKKELHNLGEGFDYFSIGSDEAGKGDLIGPLIVCAVYVDDVLSKTFKILEVKDSKDIKSFSKLEKLYKDIISSTIYHIEVIEPKDYNFLYKKYNNINLLLANAHKKAINKVKEKLENKKLNKIIIDRFSKKEYFSFDTETVQLPRAEEFMSVAAASILARYTHLKYYENLNKKYKNKNINFFLGMNPKNKAMLNKYLDNYKEESLYYLVKLNFKTIKEILDKRKEFNFEK